MKNKSPNCAYIGETKARSWLKSIIWRLIGIFILGGITWMVTHSWEKTSLITVIFHSIRLVLYYLHERWWGNIDWGRIKAADQLDKGEGI
ncbi:MAG: hypothetical protein A2137_04940 [Chloroflexi bacterium RBG_16_58_8]|nr:MAG: hypothetical protein A2137_04940 [Chloroflexi bacterium RBG_16_58_8]